MCENMWGGLRLGKREGHWPPLGPTLPGRCSAVGLGLWAGGFGSASRQPTLGAARGLPVAASGRAHRTSPSRGPSAQNTCARGRFAQGGDGSFLENPRVRREPSSEARELPAQQRVVCVRNGRDGQLCVTHVLPQYGA